VRPLGCATTPELIDRGVPQRPVEPRNDCLIVRRLFGAGDDFRDASCRMSSANARSPTRRSRYRRKARWFSSSVATGAAFSAVSINPL